MQLGQALLLVPDHLHLLHAAALTWNSSVHFVVGGQRISTVLTLTEPTEGPEFPRVEVVKQLEETLLHVLHLGRVRVEGVRLAGSPGRVVRLAMVVVVAALLLAGGGGGVQPGPGAAEHGAPTGAGADAGAGVDAKAAGAAAAAATVGAGAVARRQGALGGRVVSGADTR